MKNTQKGSSALIIVTIVVIASLVVGGYIYLDRPVQVEQISNDIRMQNEVINQTESQNQTQNPSQKNQALTEQDVLNATYTISANFNGKITSPQQVRLPYMQTLSDSKDRLYITQNGTVLINPSVPPVGGEMFWINRYEFLDDSHMQAIVYVKGNYGGSGQDNRIYTVKKVNGQIVTQEKI